MTGPTALNSLPTKNPPAQPGGDENFFSALAVFILRPQAEYQIGAATDYTKSLRKWHLVLYPCAQLPGPIIQFIGPGLESLLSGRYLQPLAGPWPHLLENEAPVPNDAACLIKFQTLHRIAVDSCRFSPEWPLR
jgi:hypothetical protein